MNKMTFHNLLRILRSIDYHEVEDAFDNEKDWIDFRDDPYSWFIKAHPSKSTVIWDRMVERHTGK